VAVGGYGQNGNDEGLTLTESWNGAKWSIMPSPNPPVSGYLDGVSCILASECVAVGSVPCCVALIETLNGSGWSVTPNPPDAYASEILRGVSCVKTGTCVAVGQNSPDAIETGPA
jgi:hypothetical protein